MPVVASRQTPEEQMLAKTRGVLSPPIVTAYLADCEWINPTPAAVDFIITACWDSIGPNGLDIRRHGTRMTKEELRERGIRGNTICSHEAYSIMTEKGKADPVAAAQGIISHLFNGYAAHARVARTAAAMGPDVMVQVTANRMAAGPCKACLAMEREPQPLSMAPTRPLPECPHPDQCVLHWHSIVSFDD